jgi:hypothetical protein
VSVNEEDPLPRSDGRLGRWGSGWHSGQLRQTGLVLPMQ